MLVSHNHNRLDLEHQIDILAFTAHPDDAELACSGTLLLHKQRGHKIGIVDLTEGELGTRGTPEIRKQESDASSQILNLDVRENLKLADGFFNQTEESLKKVIYAIRKYRPRIVLANAVSDRHPDHGNGAALVSRAFFLSGLVKIETFDNGQLQEPWRPENIYHYIQFRHIKPDFVIDVSDVWDKKMEAIQAFKSQFFDPASDEPKTLISSKKFLNYIEARHKEFGAAIEVPYGEGFTVERPLNVQDITSV